MKRGLLALILVLVVLFVSSCAPRDQLPVGTYQPNNLPPSKFVRPVIDKVEVPEEPVEPTQQAPIGTPLPALSTPIESHRLETGYGILGINSSVGSFSPGFTKYQFPELLKSRNLQSSTSEIGTRYEQFLDLRGGRVLFTGDEYDNPGDFLVYKDNEDIFEYRFVLEQGTFLDYVGEEIFFLGYPYTIKDVTKQEVILENPEIGLIVLGGGKVHFNGKTLSSTDSRMTGNEIFLIAKTDAASEGDDVFIPRGSSLQEMIGEPSLLTDKIDIRYIGISDVPHSIIEFNNKGEELELNIELPYYSTRIPLAFLTRTGFRLGDEEGTMFVKEGQNKTDYVVEREDYFVLTAPRIDSSQLMFRHRDSNTDKVSVVLQYKGMNDKYVEFVSREGVTIKASYSGVQNSDADGVINFAGTNFKFFLGVGPDYPLAIDLNGDGRVSGAVVDFLINDAIIDLPNKEVFNDSTNITFTLLNYNTASVYQGGAGLREEKAIVRITPQGEFVLELFNDYEPLELDRDNEVAVSTFGTHYFLLNQQGRMEYEEILINHPLAQRVAEIVVESS